MSRETEELRAAIATLEQRRARLQQRAMSAPCEEAELYDEWAAAAGDEIRRLRRDLYEIEAHDNLISIGRGHNLSEM